MYDHIKIEKYWREKWLKDNVYTPSLASNKKRKFYNLMMFPYPSAEGLHVGSMYAFSGADIHARFHRMSGAATFEPIGLDGFGIHSENFAIKVGRHPKEHAKISEKNFYRQLSEIGNSFAWDHRLETYDPDYYRWTQWLFIKLFKAGLAYRDKAIVNWCPNCKTVLADEQVEDGKCERCAHEVERREMSSWFFKITDYADSLLENIEKIDWPEKIKIAQRQWIGKKTGINITYPIKDSNNSVTVFTTRPDTNFGATFIVVAPEYAQKMFDAIPSDQREKVEKYIKTSLSKSEQDRKVGEREKTGVFTGLYAINQLNGYEMPIWVADYVLMDFGTGAVVGVPGHDTRDFEFADKFNLEVIRVVSVNDETGPITSLDQVQEEDGVMINSGFLNGLSIHEATEKIMDYLEEKEWGTRETSYHLRDWGISRQRYWGPPIPMINCKKCGWVPESEDNLPVVLPDIEDFKPRGDGTSPLSNASDDWKYTTCPECGAEGAERELEVSDTFLDSSWYFLAYPNIHTDEWKNGPTPFNDEITKRWFPVDAYIGGAEHAVLHLLYARFIWQVLYKENILPKELGDEPFPFLFSHGLIIKDGAKMSKSRGNVINPDDYIEKYGADALRTYLMFLGPYDGGGDFRDSGIEGMKRFVDKLYKLLTSKDIKISQSSSNKIQIKLHKTIKKVSEDLANFKYNTAIAALMELVNVIQESIGGEDSMPEDEVRNVFETLTKLVAPFMPYIAEEIWTHGFGNEYSIHTSSWPEYDESLTTDDTVNVIVQVNGKHRSTLTIDVDQASDENVVSKAALSDQNISKWVENKDIKKVIFVPGKIINFVI